MDGKREEIRKGPWKVEEDEVLINHVNKYGPRDWSSIRSKGLLQRTGKSCRLRWVNKLRPNLKNGCKFSLEEERVVIELQEQFGNKWAKIATYLPGRTDNDVKNFWSSRQKRLARILHTPAGLAQSKNETGFGDVSHDVFPNLEPQNFSSSMEEESSSKTEGCSSSYIENSEMIKMVSLPDLINPKLLGIDTNLVQPESSLIEKNSTIESQSEIPFLQIPQPQPELTFSPESQELLARLNDPNFFDILEPIENATELGIGVPYTMGPFLEPVVSCQNGAMGAKDNPMTPDSFFNDFPTDMFDPIEPLPSPSGS